MFDFHVFNLSLRGVQWMVFLCLHWGSPRQSLFLMTYWKTQDPPNMTQFTYYSKALEINIRGRERNIGWGTGKSKEPSTVTT